MHYHKWINHLHYYNYHKYIIYFTLFQTYLHLFLQIAKTNLRKQFSGITPIIIVQTILLFYSGKCR
jgi:hypothetical protein